MSTDCEGCPPEPLEDIMTKAKTETSENPIIVHLAAAIEELDANQPEDAQLYRAMRSKLVATLQYVKARI